MVCRSRLCSENIKILLPQCRPLPDARFVPAQRSQDAAGQVHGALVPRVRLFDQGDLELLVNIHVLLVQHLQTRVLCDPHLALLIAERRCQHESHRVQVLVERETYQGGLRIMVRRPEQ